MKWLPLGAALSGGTAKSIAHIGILKALVEDDIELDFIAGSSGGSIVAALYASGMPVSTMEDIARHMSWKKLVTLKLSRLGFISSKRIEEFVEELIGNVAFEELKVPCFIIATNLETGKKKVFTSGSVARAVRASCSIPQIYLPVEIDGGYYVDGGLAEYLPVETLKENGNLFVVAAHLAPVTSVYRRPNHILQLIMQLTGLMAKKNYVISEKKADFLIHPDLDGFSSFNFDNAEELIEVGYEATRRILPDLRREWRKKSGMLRRLYKKIFSAS